MSLNNINFTPTRRLIIVIVLLVIKLHAHGLTREFVWYLTKNPLFSELYQDYRKSGNSIGLSIYKYMILNHQNDFLHILVNAVLLLGHY